MITIELPVWASIVILVLLGLSIILTTINKALDAKIEEIKADTRAIW
jgi:hypothetical protein